MQQKQTWRTTSAAAAVQSIWGRQISSSVKVHSCVKLCLPELQSLVTEILFNQSVVQTNCSNFWRQSLWPLSANYHHWASCNRCTAAAFFCCTSIAAVATDAEEANVMHHKYSSSSAQHLRTADLFQCKITQLSCTYRCVKLSFPGLRSLVTEILFNQPVVRTSSSNYCTVRLRTTKSVTFIISQSPSLSLVQQVHCCYTSIAAVATDAVEANSMHHKCNSSSAEHLKTADLFQCKIT